jgi:8-oxo-dGTP pyrophosphatase MutT (NUDIX family)
MLFYFVSDDPSTDPQTVAETGLTAPDGTPFTLRPVTEAGMTDAVSAASGPVFVVDGATLPRLDVDERGHTGDRTGGGTVAIDRIPPEAVRNVAPYRPPRRVVAGGGYVTCALPSDPSDVAVLLIHRRGCWDLPKGTREPGESVRECAQREVCEEVGISQLTTHESLGTTEHGYVDGDAYAVKVTEWYRMQTPERSFEPERREGIRRVAWARWDVARRHIGYETLARHMDRVEDHVRSRRGPNA